MPDSPLSLDRSAPARRRSVSTAGIVQALRLGLFGAGLGGAAVAFLTYAVPRLPADPSNLMLAAAGACTALSAALLVHDAVKPDIVSRRRR